MRPFRTTKRWQKALIYTLFVFLIEPWPLIAYAAYQDETGLRLPIDSDDSYDFAVADIDGDGDNDVLLGNGGQSRVLINDGNGNYTDETGTRMPAFLHTTIAVALADVDGVNGIDVILAGIGQNKLLINDGSGNFTDETAVRLPVATDISMDVAAADIDADGDRDIVIANRGSRNQVWINDGSGVFTDESNARLPTDADPSYGIVLADLDGDNSPDLVVANKGRADKLFFNSRLGVFSEAPAFNTGDTESNHAAVADADKDGDNDIFIADGETGLRLWINDDGVGGSFSASTNVPASDAYGVKIAAGDIDSDGDNDVVLGAMGQDQLLLNDGTGVFSDATASDLPVDGNRTFGLAATDSDDDLDLDLLIATPQGQNRFLNNVIEAPRARITIAPDYIEATDQAFITLISADEDGIASTLVEVIQPDTTVAPAQDFGGGNYAFLTSQIGTHSVRVTLEDSLGNSSVTIADFEAQENDTTPPTLGLLTLDPSTITEGQSTQISVSATDDRVVASLSVTVDGVNVPLDVNGQANYTPPGPGALAVVATAIDAAGNSAQTNGILTVVDDVTGPVVTLNVTPDPQDITQPFTVNASATDETVLTGLEVTVTGPGGVPTDEVITLNGSGQGSFTPFVPGNYTFEATATDGGGNSTTETSVVEAVGIPDAENPVVTLLVTPGTTIAGGMATVTVEATDNVFVLDRTLTVNGGPVTLDGNNQATVNTPVLGAYTIEATATDPTGNVGTDSYTLMAIDPAGDVTPPTVAISSPVDDAQISGLEDIVGTAEDASLVDYKLQYRPIGTGPFTTFYENGISVNNGVLGEIDATMMENGTYEILLVATDLNGLQSFDNVVVEVVGELKLGHFSVEFLDKALNIGKLPVDMTRGYDSRDRNEIGDFGYGWNITTNSATLQENRSPGLDWTQTSGGGLLTTYFLTATRPHTATIRLGQFETRFRASPVPNQQTLFPIQFLTGMNYEPLDSAENGQLFVNEVPDLYASGEILSFDLSTYNPELFTYEAEDGYIYRFFGAGPSLRHELTSITDPAGTTITFGQNGFTRSDGLGLTFTRDGQGRITRMTDPNGNNVDYTYDAAGDLVAVTNGAGATTTFLYDNDHFLLEIRDPSGIPLQKQEYDDDGRLIAMTDGDGNRIEMEYDVDENTQILRDRRGNPTIYEYDDMGNVTKEISFPEVDGVATQVEVNRTFDADGNMLTVTNGNGVLDTLTYDNDSNILTSSRDTNNLNLTETFTYDSGNRVLTHEDPRGNTITNTYTPEGFLESTVDRVGTLTLHEYDSAGNLTKTTDGNGNYTTFIRDGLGNILTQERFNSSDVMLQRKTFTYDANGNNLTESVWVDVGGTLTAQTTTFTYDGADRVISTTDPNGNTTRVEYDALGRRVAEVDATLAANRTEYTYNQQDKITRIDYPDGSATVYTYDADGNRIEETNRDGDTTLMEFDPLDRITRIEFADGTAKQKRYDAAGWVIAEIDEAGNRTDYTVDGIGRRLTSQQPEVFDTATASLVRPLTTYEYDANGNRTAVVDANGNRTEYEFDAEDRLTLTRYPDATTSETLYDPVGNELRRTDPSGNAINYQYDGLDRLTRSRLPQPVPGDPFPDTTFTYDEAGRKLSETDPNGNTRTWEYDAAGNVVAHELDEGQRETFTYNAMNEVATHTDFNGDVTTYTYDAVGREIRREFDDGSSIVTAYGGSGRTESLTDSRGVTTFTFDDRGRITQKNGPDGVMSYTYSPTGEQASVQGPGGTVAYTYDALNRLATMTDQGGGVTTYAYDAVGNLTLVEHANGTTATHTYNTRNQLTSLVNAQDDGTVISSYNYTLNANGLRTNVTELDGSAITWTYDDNYRLTRETRTGTNAQDSIYTYDSAGNRLSVDRDGTVTNFTYNGNNQLLTEGAISYGYDANGNRTSKDDGGAVTNFDYDFQGRLVAATQGGVTTRYVYDALDNRVQQTDAGGTVLKTYVVDPFSVSGVAQVLEERDGGGVLQASYAVGHQRASQTRGGTTSFYHYDGGGNTRQLSDATEAVTDQYTYDAFGRELAVTGTTVNDFKFAGEQFDSTLGLYYMRARYYDQQTGIFVSRDPFAGDPQAPQTLHRYLYASNNPVNFSDPTGRFTLVSISVSISIQTNIRSVYTQNMVKLFLTAMRIAYCQLKPAYKMQEIALAMISSDLPGGFELYLQAQTQISAGFKALSNAIADTYKAIADDLNPLNIEISGALVDLYNVLTATNPLSAAVGQIIPFKNQLEGWLNNYEQAMRAVSVATSGDECEAFKLLEDNADFVISLIPGL